MVQRTSEEFMQLTVRDRFARWLGIDLEGKAEVYGQVYSSADLASVSYWAEVALSAGIATLGLVQNSPAVIIGAMLISPLMGAILSTGLALAVGDSYLLLKSFLNIALSMAASVGLAALLVWLLPFHSVTQEILSRIHPNLLDLGIAVLSGLAGSIVVCRGGSGTGVMALPGVAIAVALMPPLCVMGFGMGSSFNMEIMYGASLLFLTNLVAIVSSAFVVFLLVGMDDRALRSQIGETEGVRAEHEKLYRALQSSSLRKLLYLRGSLRWRMVTLLILLGIVFVPLRAGLIQVKNEAIARNAVIDAIQGMVPAGALVTQNVRYAPDRVRISIVSARPIDADAIEKARSLIERRTGTVADIAVQEVASRRELTDLMDRLNTPPPPPPKPATMASLESNVLGEMSPALKDVWPEATPLQKWEMGFSPDGPVLHLTYESRTTMDKFAVSLLEQTLRTKLGLPKLTVTTQRVRPTRRPAPARSTK
jgi:uncharacterized hydrophobic protein (TIGR00271 family)